MTMDTLQQISDALDQHSVRITTAQSAADTANTEAARALSRIYDVDLGSTIYTDTEIEKLKTQLRQEFNLSLTNTFDNIDVTLVDRINNQVPSMLLDRYGSYTAMQTLYNELLNRFGQSDTAIDELFNTVLPGIQMELDNTLATVNGIETDYVALSGSLKAVLVVYAATADGTDQSLVPENREYVKYVEYTGFPPSLPVSGTFVKFVGDATSVWPIYADDQVGNNQSFSPGNRSWVTFYESGEAPTLPVTGQTFVRYVGEDGASRYFASAFKRTNGTPGMPSGGFYDFGTKTLMPPNGWLATIPDGPDPLWITTTNASIQGQVGSDTTLEWSTPVKFAQNGSEGARGPGRWDIGTGSMPTGSAQVDAVWNSGTGDQPTRPVVGDQVWIYTGAKGNPTDQKVYVCTAVYSDTSHAWEYMDKVMRGNLLVEDSVFASAIKVGDFSIDNTGNGITVKGGGITILKDNFYTANTPIYGNGFSTPPSILDLSLVGGNVIQIPPYFVADLQIVCSFEHGYYNLSGFEDDWGLQISGNLQDTPVEVLYERFNPTMTLETDFATISTVKKNIVNSSSLTKNYYIYVMWGGGSSDIRLMDIQTSVFMRFK